MRNANIILGLTLGLSIGCSGEVGIDGGDALLPGGIGMPSTAGAGPDLGAAMPGTGGAGSSGSVTGVPTGNVAPGGGAGPITSPAGAGAASVTTVVQDGTFPPAPMLLEGQAIYTRFMRLTNAQWERAVQDILELPAPPDKARFFQTAVVASTDFVNNEEVLEMTNDLWAQHKLAVEEVVLDFTATDAALQSLYSGSDARELIATLGRRAYRRPLTTAEIDRFETIFNTGSALTTGGGSSFTKGAGLVIEAMLQSPHFVYRTELGSDGAPLSGFEMASKLSFFIRGTTPSDELLDQAEAGSLDTTAGAVSAATQLLEAPDATRVFVDFHSELFEFGRISGIQKDVDDFDPEINPELLEASERYFEHLYTENLGVREMLTSTQGYVGPLMAELYDLPEVSSMQLMDLGAERPGYFSQVPYLLLYGDNEHADAIHRGVHLNFEVLCANIPPPPPEVQPLQAAAGGQTNRERTVAGTLPCGAGCHDAYINPVGFAFENFDGLGRIRETDQGFDVDTAGSYPFADGTQDFANAQELMEIMASTQMAHACYANHIAGYALQRNMVAGDAALIEQLMNTSLATGSSIKQLVLNLVAHPSFATRNGGSL